LEIHLSSGVFQRKSPSHVIFAHHLKKDFFRCRFSSLLHLQEAPIHLGCRVTELHEAQRAGRKRAEFNDSQA
jgi:hypothetical protein